MLSFKQYHTLADGHPEYLSLPANEAGPTWDEVLSSIPDLSLNRDISVYALAQPHKGHPAGMLAVINGSEFAPHYTYYLEVPPQQGFAIKLKGVDAHLSVNASGVHCSVCPELCKDRKSIVEGVGPYQPRFMFIAEAPGREEDEYGTPFVGASGQLLRATLSEVGLSARECYFTNTIRCRPPNNRDPRPEELAACSVWLQDEIERVSPASIVLLGRVAASRETSIRSVYDGPIYQAAHPAYLLRFPAKRAAWRTELDSIVRGAGFVGAQPTTIAPTAPVSNKAGWQRGTPDFQAQTLAVDIETDDLEDGYAKRVITVQVADAQSCQLYEPVHPVAFPCNGPIRLRESQARRPMAPGASSSVGTALQETVADESSNGQADGRIAHVPHAGVCELAAHDPGDTRGESSPLARPDNGPDHRPIYVFDPNARHHYYANVKYDGPQLGLDLYDLSKWDDISLVAYVLREPRVGLKEVGPKYTGIPMESITKNILRERVTTKRIPTGNITKLKKDGRYRVQIRSGTHSAHQLFYGVYDTWQEAEDARVAWCESHGVPPERISEKWVSIPFSRALESNYEAASAYALKDGIVTARVADILMEKLREIPVSWRYYHQIEKPVVPIVAKLEQAGAMVDEARLLELRATLQQEQAQAVHALARLTGAATVNWNAPRQVAETLKANGFKLYKKTPTGETSVDRSALLAALHLDSVDNLDDSDGRHALVKWYLHLKTMRKLETTYVDALLAKRDALSRVHGRFNQMVTDTSRFSSSDPNLQNIPIRNPLLGKAFRRCFVARAGYVLVKADFSQLELRIYADYTREPLLLNAYLHTQHDTLGPEGKCLQCDVHQQVANEFTEFGVPRWRAKNGIFAALYMAGADQLSRTFGIPLDRSQAFHTLLRERLPSLGGTWKDSVVAQLVSKGYVETRYGWRNYYPLYFSPIPKESKDALKAAGNCPIQGTAGGVLKKLLVKADAAAIAYDADLILTVHDEVVYEVPIANAKPFAKALSEAGSTCAPELSVPLVLEALIGPDWGTLAPWETWQP